MDEIHMLYPLTFLFVADVLLAERFGFESQAFSIVGEKYCLKPVHSIFIAPLHADCSLTSASSRGGVVLMGCGDGSYEALCFVLIGRLARLKDAQSACKEFGIYYST